MLTQKKVFVLFPLVYSFFTGCMHQALQEQLLQEEGNGSGMITVSIQHEGRAPTQITQPAWRWQRGLLGLDQERPDRTLLQRTRLRCSSCKTGFVAGCCAASCLLGPPAVWALLKMLENE